MQEIKWSGFDAIKERVTEDEICQAVRDKSNKRVIVHAAGSRFTDSRGREYEVWTDGSVRKVKHPEREAP